MRILLVRPKEENVGSIYNHLRNQYNDDRIKARGFLSSNLVYPPLNLQAIAGLTPPEHEVRIVDEYIEPIKYDTGFDLVGITSYGNTNKDREHIGEIASGFLSEGTSVIIGGPHISRRHKKTIPHVIGEAESTWKSVLSDTRKGKLLGRYESKTPADLKEFAGAVPRRDLTKNRFYPFQSIETSRGCTNRCSFCTNTLHRPYRTFPVERTLSEIENCLENPGFVKKYIHFADNNMASQPSHKIELLRRAKDYNIMWHAYSDISAGKNPRLLRAFADSGCLSLNIGIESLSQPSLDYVGKNFVKASEFEGCIRSIQDFGISVNAGFIVGIYHDTRESIRDIFRFVEKTGIKLATINMLGVDKRTRVFQDLERDGALEYSKDDGTFLPKTRTLSFRDLENEFIWLERRMISNRSIKQNENYRRLKIMPSRARPPVNPRIGLRNISRLVVGSLRLASLSK